MDIGMLWFDNDQKSSIPTKVARAADYYQKKYGKDPDLCYVHPGMLQEAQAESTGKKDKGFKIGRVRVEKHDQVLPNHFWIGVSR